MKKEIFIWQFSGIAIVSFLGTILHFLYQWTGFLPISLISSVNESTWEHMKLMFTPMLLFAIVEYFDFKSHFDNFWCVKFLGIVLGILLVPILFYTLSGIFGKLSGIVNICIFFTSVILAFTFETYLFKNWNNSCSYKLLFFIALCIIWILFAIFTFYPPEIPLFLDPLSNTYGIQF